MKKIVIKMRNLKKMLGNELLQLALMLSLMRVDPDSLLSSRQQSHYDGNYDSSDLINNGSDVWTQTRFGDNLNFGGIGGDMSPRLHPKSMDSLLDRFQNEILDDLNSLGRYNRISSYQGIPVEISAYVVNTPEPAVASSSSSSTTGANRPETDSDSGISDTEATPSNFGSDSESDKEDDRASPEGSRDEEEELLLLPVQEFEEIIVSDAQGEESNNNNNKTDEDVDLDSVVNPYDILEGPVGPAFLPDPEDLENQLFQIDDQLITIDENLDEISDEFLHLDEQLAAHIDEEDENAAAYFDTIDHLLDHGGPEQPRTNPFDEWQMDSHRDLDEFFHLSEDLFTESEKEKESSKFPEGAAAAAVATKEEEDVRVKIEDEIDIEPMDIPEDAVEFSLPFDIDLNLVSDIKIFMNFLDEYFT